MASIPLPALDVKPPQQQPDIMSQYGNLLRLKAMQTQLENAPLETQQLQNQVQSSGLQVQQQQQALKDQKAMTAAMMQWDGKNYNDLMPLVLKNGGSAQAVIGLKKNALEMQTQVATAAKDNAQAAQANVTATQKKNDLITGALSPLLDPKQIPDAQLPQTLLSTVQSLTQQGLLDPQHAQKAAQLAQSGDPNAIRQGVDQFRKTLMAQSQILDEGLKTAQTQQAQTGAQVHQLEIQNGGPLTDTTRFVSNWLKTNNLPDTPANRLRGQQEYIKETKINPAQVRVDAYGNTREYPVFDSQTKQTVWMTPNEINAAKVQQPGRFTDPVYSPEAIGQKGTTTYFTSGKGGQQLNAFNTAMQHLDTLQGLANDLGNSNLQVFNRAAQRWAQETGNPAPASFDAAKNAMSGEVAAALKASGATDPEITKVESTFSRAQSPMQLKGAISTYKVLLRSKAHNLQNQYNAGMQGQPNFQEGNSNSSANSASGGLSVTAPNGKTYTFKDQASADAFKENAGIQ